MTTANGRTLEGTVERVTDTGLRLDGEWYSCSKFKPVDLPEVGAHVRLVTDDKRFIKSVELLTAESANAVPHSAARDQTIRRLAVLKSAAAFGASRPDLKSSDVLRIADAWRAWIES
jgi:hypothetical protein